MPKNVLVVSASLRADSNSEALAEAFARGAREAGHKVELISLKGKKIAFCRGCLACLQAGRCVIDDDAIAIADKIRHADVVAFASPVYYYGLSGQLKTLLDRSNSLYGNDYAFRDIYLLAAAAEEGNSTVEGSVKGLQGWIDCFEKASLAGTIFAGGVNRGGDIRNHPALEKAYETGKAV